MENTSPETNETNSTEETIKVPQGALKRIRPDIEGITIPATNRTGGNTKPKLTPAELKLIRDTEETNPTYVIKSQEQKIVLPSHKSHYLLRTLLSIVFIAILALAGYKGYLWYINRPTQEIAQQNNDNTALPQPEDNLSSTSSSGILTDNDTTTTASTTLQTASPDTASSTNIVSVPASPKLKVNSTPTGFLNVRKSPSTGSAIIAKIYPGETYPFTNNQNDWYQITLPDGTTGWVAGQYVSKM